MKTITFNWERKHEYSQQIIGALQTTGDDAGNMAAKVDISRRSAISDGIKEKNQQRDPHVTVRNVARFSVERQLETSTSRMRAATGFEDTPMAATGLRFAAVVMKEISHTCHCPGNARVDSFVRVALALLRS